MKPGQDGEDMFATFEKRPCSLEGRECEAHVRGLTLAIINILQSEESLVLGVVL